MSRDLNNISNINLYHTLDKFDGRQCDHIGHILSINQEPMCMIWQTLFSGKKNKKRISMTLLKILPNILSVQTIHTFGTPAWKTWLTGNWWIKKVNTNPLIAGPGIGAFVGDVTSLCVAHYAVHIKPKVGHSFSLNTLITPINILN